MCSLLFYHSGTKYNFNVFILYTYIKSKLCSFEPLYEHTFLTKAIKTNAAET